MLRGLHGIFIFAALSAVTLSMGACPSVEPGLPGGINVTTDGATADPVFLPPSGTFADTMDVVIFSPTIGATIGYTLDGTTPSESNGTVYSGPITLTQTTTIQAIAFATGFEPSDVVSQTFTRTAVAASLSLSNPTVYGQMVQGQSCTLGVACTATATGSQVRLVTANLSQIGGSAAQLLTANGNYWSWIGPVTPTVTGTCTITVTAVDTSDDTRSVTATIVVSAASTTNAAPTISDPAATGQLVCGQACTVNLTCTASDWDGTVQSVRGDLSSIGGPGSQSLTLQSGQWKWSGSVTPPFAGTRTVTFTATDDDGASTTASATISVSANHLPVVSVPAVAGALVQGQAGTISISCVASDADGPVASVRADLSVIGGPLSQALTLANGTWGWTGSVTPAASGTRTVTFTALDIQGANGTAVATVGVATPQNQPPSIGSPSASGTLTVGQSGTVTVSCTASDADGSLQSVCANLSAIGGSANQLLALVGGVWTWTGTVTPVASGSRTITFTATDDQAATASTTTSVTVAAANQAPTVSGATAAGTLILNVPGSVTVSCTAADVDGTVQAVAADLSGIGGSATQVLAFANGQWTWTGSVTPAAAGSRTVTFTATDNGGLTGTATATINVLGSQPGSVAGTWAGDVTWSQSLVVGGTGTAPTTFVRASTIAFEGNYQPQALLVYFGQTGTIVALPATSLLNPGDQQTTSSTSNGTTTTVTGTVTSVSRGATAFAIDLDLQITYTGTTHGTLAGPYHFEAALQAGDQLSWSQTSLLTVGGIGIDLNVGSVGTLTRQ